jgi:hypothetical protein
VFNPIPFQPSFDTSSITRLYVRLPFPSGCLDSKEEDGLGFGLDFSGLQDPESMLQFLHAYDELLSDSSEGYNTAGKATTQPGNASISTKRSLTRETILACPGKVTSLPHALGKQWSQARPRPLLGAT